jgi:hypothetical protein
MTTPSTIIDAAEKVVRPSVVISGLTLLLAADLVSLWSGHASILLQQPWSHILSELTPTFLVEVILLMVLGQWLVIPILQYLLAPLILRVPDWVTGYQTYKGDNSSFISIDELERLAIAQNNSVAWEYVKNTRKALRHEGEIGRQIGLFLLFLILDWLHGGSLAAAAAGYVWFLYLVVCGLYLWIVASAYRYRADGCKVYVGNIGETLRSESTPKAP